LIPAVANEGVAFLSPCGFGNLGDAAIVESLLHAIRLRRPGAPLVGFTQNPSDTRLRHGVEAHTILGFSPPDYGVREAEPDSGAMLAALSALDRARRIPLLGRVVGTFTRALRESRHLARSSAALRRAGTVVVAGGGQLDDLYGGAAGQPYALLRWALLARARGARFVALSVGTGRLTGASRPLVRAALRLAAYRSFRDGGSRELLEAPEFARDPLVPDLAFAVPRAPPQPSPEGGLVVGLSPMAFHHPSSWPSAKEASRYQSHIDSFAQLSRRLLLRGDRVTLFTTAVEPDAVRDTVTAIGPLPEPARARLGFADTPDLESLFRALDSVHLVVAARLHGTLLAHVSGRPVLAVAHERKVRAHMEQMGHSAYCIDIQQFDADEGLRLLDGMSAERRALGEEVEQRVRAFRAQVEDQYDLLFGAVQATANPPAAR
jgi:polysaccharide pyruvyl transferase WcaK-like protein